MLKTKKIELPESSLPPAETPGEIPAQDNIVTIARGDNYYLGDIVADFHYVWYFDGDLTRYKDSITPALSFFTELECILHDTVAPPQKLYLKDIAPLDFDAPEPGVLEECMLHVFSLIGKHKIQDLHLEGFKIPEAAFVELLTQLSYQARDETLVLESLTLTNIPQSGRCFKALIQVLSTATTITSINITAELTEEETKELIRSLQKNPNITDINYQSTTLLQEQRSLLQAISEERKASKILSSATPFEKFVMSCQVSFADEKKRKLNQLHEADLMRRAQGQSTTAYKNMKHFIENANYQVFSYRTGVAAARSGLLKTEDAMGEYAEEAILFGGSVLRHLTGFDPALLGKIPVFVDRTDLNGTRVKTLGSYLRSARVEKKKQKEHETALLIENLSRQDTSFFMTCVLRLAEIYEPTLHLLATPQDVKFFTQAIIQKFLNGLYKCATNPHTLQYRSVMDVLLLHVVNPLSKEDPLATRLKQKTNRQKIQYFDPHTKKVKKICVWDAVETKNIIFENQDKVPHMITFVDLESTHTVEHTEEGLAVRTNTNEAVELTPRSAVYALSDVKHERLYRRAVRDEVGTMHDKQLVYYPDGYAFYADRMKALHQVLEEAKSDASTIVDDLHVRFERMRVNTQAMEEHREALSGPRPALLMHSGALQEKEMEIRSETASPVPDDEIAALEQMLAQVSERLTRVKSNRK